MKDKEITQQLIEDAHCYREHPGCKKLIGFIYDPDSILDNPAAIKKDLEKNDFCKIIVAR